MVAVNPREEFLAAATLEGDNPEKLIHFAGKHVSKRDEFDLGEIFLSLSNKQHGQLWTGIFGMCGKALERLRDLEYHADGNTAGDGLKEALVCIEAITDVLLAAIDQETQVIPSNMTATCTVLHGVMLDLPDEAEKLRQKITKVCQVWWVKNLPGAERLAPNMTLCILSRCAEPSVTRADIRAASAIRKALNLIQWRDPSSADLELLLKRCLINPSIHKPPEGVSFLSHLFLLDVALVEVLHSTIKAHLPSCPKSLAQSYGEIYFKAWKQASGDILTKIEEHCIQDLMYLAAHAPTGGGKSLASILRQVLGQFAKYKKMQGVDKMLLRLYNPILWRALSAANAGVRGNAANLLVDVFPLQDPESNKEEMDLTLQKQIDALETLLDDPCPNVRVLGIKGVCNIVGKFWELIPAQTLAVFLTKLIQQLAHDSSSTDVRVSVFMGLNFVLDNPMSHPLMKHLLPSVKDFIHDSSEKVIVALLDLLIKIKGIKTIKVFSIVQLEDLLVRLEMDSPPVARRIVKLLFKSFHPTDYDASSLIERLITLIRANKGASRVFYRYATSSMSMGYSVDFLLLICRCIRGCIRDSKEKVATSVDSGGDVSLNTNTSNSSSESQAGTDEKENEDDDGLSLEDTDVMEGMLEVAAVLWSGISPDLAKPVNEALKQKLVTKYAKALPDFLATFQEGRSVQAILVLSTYLPASSIPSFSNGCLSSLKCLPDYSTSDTYSPLLACLASWGRGSDVLDMIINWFIPALQDSPSATCNGEEDFAKENASKKKRKVAFIEPIKPRPEMGFKYLEALLQHYPSYSRLFRLSAHKVVELTEVLAYAKGRIEKRLLGGAPVVSDEVLIQSLSMHMRLLIHLQVKFMSEDEDASASTSASSICLRDFTPQLVKMMTWTEQELVPLLKSFYARERSPDKHLLHIATNVIKTLLVYLDDTILLSVTESDFVEEVTRFTQLVLQTDYSMVFMPAASKLLFHLSKQSMQSFFQGANSNVKVKDYTSPVLMSFIKSLSSCLKMQQGAEVQGTLSAIKPALSECLKSCNTNQTFVPAMEKEVMSTVMASTLMEISDEIRQSGRVPVEPADDLEDLPVLSSFLLGTLNSSQPLLSSFVVELQRCLSVGALEKTSDLCAALKVLCALKKGGKKINNLEECLEAAERQLTSLAPEPETDKEEAEEEEGSALERFWFTEAQKLHGIATGKIQPLPSIMDDTPPKKRAPKRQNATAPPLTSQSEEDKGAEEAPLSAPPLGVLISSLNTTANSSGNKSKRKLYDGSSSLLL